MFGSKKLQEANAQLDALRRELDREKNARTEAEKQLKNANSRVSELEAQLADTDLEALKEQAKETIAEYEGLKSLYTRKVNEFDSSREEKEQAFARDAALQRHSLENEIRDNRQANQDYVSNTVKTFSESYNYYLNQIKTLMDALGNVAARTGKALFAAENADLKEQFGLQMVEELKSGLDGMKNNDGNRILIGAAEEAIEQTEECDTAEDSSEEIVQEVSEAAGEICETAEDCVEKTVQEACEAVEETCEAAAEAAEDVCGQCESAEETVSDLAEAVNEVSETVEEAAAESVKTAEETFEDIKEI